MSHFNLIDEPWIPIRSSDPVSLKQIFSTERLKNIGGNAVNKISLTKFLLAIIQTAWTPQDNKQWEKDGIAVMPHKVLEYLNKNHDLFYLYGDKPFLQVPVLKTINPPCPLVAIGTGDIPKPCAKNNPILFQSQSPTELSDAQRALFLVSLMNMALMGKGENGGSSLEGLNRTWVGYTKLGKPLGKPLGARPGPGTGDSGYMHSFSMGRTILETLWFNVLTLQDIAKQPVWKNGLGTPPWESFPITESQATNLKNSYMGCLVGVSRFVLFDNEKTGKAKF
jgi:CRISPR system Cascade subunit CasA